jgi:hypothetical protein
MSPQMLLTHFLEQFAHKLSELYTSGHFTDQWLLDGRYNKDSRLHARLWGALIGAAPPGYVPNVELLVHTPGRGERSFKPDLIICNSADKQEMMIELESTNSSDQRVIYRDIDRLSYVARLEEPPRLALLITVLPSQPVSYLPMYDGLPAAKRAQRRKNPYAFHVDDYLNALDQLLSSNIPFSVAWANLDVNGLYLEFWNGRYQRRRIWKTKP